MFQTKYLLVIFKFHSQLFLINVKSNVSIYIDDRITIKMYSDKSLVRLFEF